MPRDLAQVLLVAAAAAFRFAVAATSALENELQVLDVVFLPMRYHLQLLGPGWLFLRF